jgi:hypothetical protein
MVGARLTTLKHGQRADYADAPNGASVNTVVTAQTEAAEMLGVGRATIQQAKEPRLACGITEELTPGPGGHRFSVVAEKRGAAGCMSHRRLGGVLAVCREEVGGEGVAGDVLLPSDSGGFSDSLDSALPVRGANSALDGATPQ